MKCQILFSGEIKKHMSLAVNFTQSATVMDMYVNS